MFLNFIDCTITIFKAVLFDIQFYCINISFMYIQTGNTNKTHVIFFLLINSDVMFICHFHS